MKLRGPLYFDTGPRWQAGAGSPEGVVTAPIGSMYSRTDGAADTAVYRKETGTGNTGWVPIADVYVATTAPPGTANSGDLWYDTDEPTSLVMPMSVANGGTGGTSPTMARTNLSVPYVGNSTTTAGPPTTGTYVRGDHWLDVSNVLWVCTVGGSPGTWISASSGEELAYNEITASATTTAATAAAATVAIEGTTRAYDGSPVLVEFYTALLYSPAVVGAWVVANLWDGNTDLGQFGQVGGGSANGIAAACCSRRRITPTVGTHNYRIKAWISSSGGGTGTVGAGGGYMAAFIRVTRV